MKSKKIDYNKLKVWAYELESESKCYSDDWYLSLYLQIALHTGLRARDILSLKKNNFDFENNTFEITTQKTKADSVFALPKNVIKNVQIIGFDDVFKNKKYGSIYSLTWVNKRLKKQFGGGGVSSHSIRKAVGHKAYEFGGINGARNILTHSNFKHTATYLELDKIERLSMQKQMFNLI